MAAHSSSLALFHATLCSVAKWCGFTISDQETKDEREVGVGGVETDTRHTKVPLELREKYALVSYVLNELTETRIVLEEIQKLQALFQVVPTVAAVTPRGHTEATGIYVVGGHDCT